VLKDFFLLAAIYTAAYSKSAVFDCLDPDAIAGCHLISLSGVTFSSNGFF
jgi:hypothetical protein